MYPRINLWIRICQLFRNFIHNATHHKQFGSGLTVLNEVHSISNIHCYKNKNISLTIINLCLCTSLWAVNPEPNCLLWVALQMKFLNNWQILIHKLIHGYITSNVCKIIFWILCLTLAWNLLSKTFQWNVLIKPGGNKNHYTLRIAINVHTINLLYTVLYNTWRFFRQRTTYIKENNELSFI